MLIRQVQFAVSFFLFGFSTAFASINPGHILVSDSATSSIIDVDPLTGNQVVLSSGGLLHTPSGVALSNDGFIYVSDRTNKSIVRIDPDGGGQSLVSSEGYFQDPFNLSFLKNGQLAVVDTDAFGGPGGVIQVNPQTGDQTPVSYGGIFTVTTGIVVESSSGMLIVGDRGPQAAGNDGVLIRINCETGMQSVLTSSGLLWNPDHIVISSSGDIYVSDHDSPDFGGSVIRVNPITGEQYMVTSGGYFSGGPSGIAFSSEGIMYVSDHNAFGGTGGIIRIDILSGVQTVISHGGYFVDPYAIVVVPTPEPSSFLLVLGMTTYMAMSRIRSFYGNVLARQMRDPV